MKTTLQGHTANALRARRTTLVGTVFDGRYEVKAKIASGGFGSIYRAVDLQTGIDVALKVLHAELAKDRSLATRFRREGEMLAMLRDPRTVQTFGAGETADGTLFIALELLEGETLEQRFARGPLAWREMLAILRDVCSSIGEAHANGIVHRDLKPGNVFLSREGVKVIDFGIAKLVESSDGEANITRSGQAIGTLDYMAPEQLVGGDCDARTDLFTLGVVAYEAITGVRPFADAIGATGLITALLTRTPLSPSMRVATIPVEVDGIILKMLEREPDDRFASANALALAIDRVIGAPIVEYDDEVTTVDFVMPKPVSRAPDDDPAIEPPTMAAIGPHVSSTGLAYESTVPQPRISASISVQLPAMTEPNTVSALARTAEMTRGPSSAAKQRSLAEGSLPQNPVFADGTNPVLAEGTIDGEEPVLASTAGRCKFTLKRVAVGVAVALSAGAAWLVIS